MNINYLKEVMFNENINISTLAKKADIGRTTVSEILSGVRTNIRLSTAQKIANALNVEIEQLCKEA